VRVPPVKLLAKPGPRVAALFSEEIDLVREALAVSAFSQPVGVEGQFADAIRFLSWPVLAHHEDWRLFESPHQHR